MSDTYKQHFLGAQEAARYDDTEYSSRSYSNLLWAIERGVLQSLVAEHRRKHRTIHYLDFAAGTGRIAGLMEGKVDSATAIEVSESMAARARERLLQTNVLCRDITADANEREGSYNLITAFRFFLNAEPGLRLAAMRALAERLQNEDSWLVFNNHGNLWSLKLIGWPYHRLRGLGSGWRPYGNYMSHAEVRALLDQAGLQIVKTFGLGVLGGKICALLNFDRSLSLERRLAESRFFQNLGQDRIYVVRRRAHHANKF